jgi:hypothetical protein
VKRKAGKIAEIKGGNCIANVYVATEDDNNMSMAHQWRV